MKNTTDGVTWFNSVCTVAPYRERMMVNRVNIP